MTVILTQGASKGATTTWPPSCAAPSAIASASSTAKVTLQCAGTSGWSPARGVHRGHTGNYELWFYENSNNVAGVITVSPGVLSSDNLTTTDIINSFISQAG
jgi:hypothetical protein